MVIMPTGGDVKSSVELFEKNDTHKLMREGHFREGKTVVAEGFNAFGQAVGATDNEGEVALTGYGSLFDEGGKLLA